MPIFLFKKKHLKQFLKNFKCFSNMYSAIFFSPDNSRNSICQNLKCGSCRLLGEQSHITLCHFLLGKDNCTYSIYFVSYVKHSVLLMSQRTAPMRDLLFHDQNVSDLPVSQSRLCGWRNDQSQVLQRQTELPFLRSLAESQPTLPFSPSPAAYLYDSKKEGHTQINLLLFAEQVGDSDPLFLQGTMHSVFEHYGRSQRSSVLTQKL